MLSLAASLAKKKVKGGNLSGVVIDSGDGVTHVIPVVSIFTMVVAKVVIPVRIKPRSAFLCPCSLDPVSDPNFQLDGSGYREFLI